MQESKQLRIHSPGAGPRLTYVLDLLFSQLLGIGYEVVQTVEAPVHLSYAPRPEGSGLHLVAHGLLEESGTRQSVLDELRFEPWEGSHGLFRTSEGRLPFDLFAATFFLCSRYEEYLDFYPDEHDRFTPRESVLFQEDLLEEPLVNQWALILRTRLNEVFPDLQFAPRKFTYTSTLDIDQTWKYRRKGLRRNTAGFFRDLMHGKWENFRERIPVLLGLRPDPFYNFDWQHRLHERYNTEVHYFFLLGERAPYDKNIPATDRKQIRLIRELHAMEHTQVGIHPSYRVSQLINAEHPQALQRLREEIDLLSRITGPVQLSRQHYLMHRFPQTPEALARLEILEDHTLGYSSAVGFRAGIAAPFPFYDLRRESSTGLIQVPFCLMDITPLHYMEVDPQEAIAHMRSLMAKVKAVGGHFVSLWHNESLGETERWKGWRVLYEQMIREAAN